MRWLKLDPGSERLMQNIPRDRQFPFDQALIGKHHHRFPGFNEKSGYLKSVPYTH